MCIRDRNIVIAKRREVSEKGATHYAYKSEYQRNTNQPTAPAAEPQSTIDQEQGVMPDSMDDDLPF